MERRRDRRFDRGRAAVGLAVAVACALILFAVGAGAQAVEKTWSERVNAAQGDELEDLLVEMDAEALRAERGDADFGVAYYEAALRILAVATPGPDGERVLLRRVERARRVAGHWGSALHRLRVENEYATVLVAKQDLEHAERILLDALTEFGSERRGLAGTWIRLVSAAAETCRFEVAEARAREFGGLLDAMLAEERVDSDLEDWLVYHLVLRIEMLGVESRVYALLGLPDEAARRVVSQRALIDELGDRGEWHHARIFAALDSITFLITIQRFEQALGECEGLLAANLELSPGERTTLASHRGLALAGIARRTGGPIQAAADLYDELLAVADLVPAVREAALLGIVPLDLRRGDLEAAERHLDELAEQIGVSTQAMEPCSRPETRERIAAHRAQLALARGDPPTALRACRTDLEESTQTMLARRTRARRAGGVGFLHWGSARLLLSERIRLEIALEGEARGAEEALAALVHVQTFGSFSRDVGAGDVELREIREHLLEPGVGGLVYLPSWERSHLLAIDGETVRHFELPSRDAIVAAVESFALELALLPSDPAAGGARAEVWLAGGSRLRAMLLPDAALEHVRSWNGAYVVGADLLANPPFEALPMPSGRSLGGEFALSHLPSLPVGVWLARRAAARDGAATERSALRVLAGPEHSPDVLARWSQLQPFELARQDRDALERSFARGPITFVEGREATRDSLGGEALDRALALEIFTHGVYDANRARPAGLVLGADQGEGVLWCEDIEATVQPPPLVALFACGSALGPSRLGDDSSAQLGNAFLARGADTVVLSRAKLAYGAVIDLACAFNAELDAGRATAPAEALRHARARLEASASWNDPFHHGQVTSYGLGLRTLERPVDVDVRRGPESGGEEENGRSTMLAGIAVAAALVLALVVIGLRSIRSR